MDGCDYGRIPCGCPKLLKSGAEKIVSRVGAKARLVFEYGEGGCTANVVLLNPKTGEQMAYGVAHADSMELAEERALIDATISLGAFSGDFTQDGETECLRRHSGGHN